MTVASAPYPPSPANVPPDIATPTSAYRLRVFVVLASLLLFVFLYFGLIVGSGYLCYSCVMAVFGKPPEFASRPLIKQANALNAQLNRRYDAEFGKWQLGVADWNSFAMFLERELLPPGAEQARLQNVHGLPADEQQLVNQCAILREAARRSCERHCRAGAHEPELVEESDKRNRAAEQFGREVLGRVEQYHAEEEGTFTRSPLFNIALGIVAFVLCLFLIKGLFKSQRSEIGQRVEVTAKDQPMLFDFITRLCRDTRAPLPHRVYLTPEVNAGVFYHESILNLFWPVPKNLMIGLGLVNQLNLSEFKAVLAARVWPFLAKEHEAGQLCLFLESHSRRDGVWAGLA